MTTWQAIALLALGAIAASVVYWLVNRRRPVADVETTRRIEAETENLEANVISIEQARSDQEAVRQFDANFGGRQ